MIVPSIDIMDGRAVQLVGGKEKVLDGGDPLEIARRWSLAGELAVIDLDAALGRGSNEPLIQRIVRAARCRVGGGIRSVEAARDWLDAGAEKVILGTAATPEVLSQLPRERVIAALDAVDGEVVVKGWREATGHRIEDRLPGLRDLVSGFLITFVEGEGRMEGIDLERVRRLAERCGGAKLTAAGGVTTLEEVAQLDVIGADAQVGMALYTGAMSMPDALLAPMKPTENGLWPTVIVDEHGVALGLAWSNRDSVRTAIEERRGVYWSRSRNSLWRKGATSGATQALLRVDLDCDRDALRFTVRQENPGFCHQETRTCWGEDWGLPRLARRIAARLESAAEGSYTSRLIREEGLLESKLIEEAGELAATDDADAVRWEAADVMYFTLVAMAKRGVSLEQIARELDRRERLVRRRAGNAKPAPTKEH